MSKMSQLHAELTEQANELGFRSIEEAEANGYHITYTDNKVKLAFDMSKTEEAYTSRREEILNKLDGVIAYLKGTDESDEGAYMIRELQDVEEYVKWA